MAFTEKEIECHQEIVNAYVEQRRSPVHVRDRVDLSFRIYDQGIEIFESRSVGRVSQHKTESFIFSHFFHAGASRQ